MLRVKKLDIFIVKQFSLLFAGTFFICLFVLMMQFLWRYVDELIGKGLSMEILAQFFGYMALMLVPQALPLAILLSSLIAYGNLGESSKKNARGLRDAVRREIEEKLANAIVFNQNTQINTISITADEEIKIKIN